MEEIKRSYCMLVIGKTQESTEASEGFKRYVGLGSSYVLAVNPEKKELDELMGFESANEPEYVKDGDNGKEAHIHFIVRTDPETNDGIEITNRLMFTLRQAPAYSRDEKTVQAIDAYGNSSWVDAELAKAGKQLPPSARIDQNHYRIACVGECDLVTFLKKYLGVPESMKYSNGVWSLNDKADDGKFGLEHIKDYFNGDFSELRDALAYQPNNKIKLLYGVRTNDEGKQYQAIAARGDLMLRNNAGSKAILKLEKDLASAKERGAFATTDFRVQNLQEYIVEPTNLDNPAPADNDSSFDLPWGA